MEPERITDSILKEKLVKGFEATHVEVKDNSDGCGLKFEVVIVSTHFQGKRLLDRHRMVHECLAGEIKTIHAFQQKTYTPEQWANLNKS